ncbi:hypothetical protein PIB30_048932 [Stylosanthes scabra]|uniref:Uncharacterized protein n=1 Tax=Stylosanthes scabra TaxID=79078 RepID=A0ABU6YFZ8_9FABA|nr:hypothetical protein [Stylosanthes scabra]
MSCQESPHSPQPSPSAQPLPITYKYKYERLLEWNNFMASDMMRFLKEKGRLKLQDEVEGRKAAILANSCAA